MLTGNLKLKYLAGLTVLVFAYLAWAQFSLWLAPVAQPYVPPIWPPTGIGLAVVIIFGYRYWPGIFVGECALAASMDIPVQVALGIGVGNTLEAMLGAYLLQRVTRLLRSCRKGFSSYLWSDRERHDHLVASSPCCPR